MVVSGIVAGLIVFSVAGLAVFDVVNDGIGVLVVLTVVIGVVVFFALWRLIATLTLG